MTSPVELALLIRQTQAFVDADAEEIVLTPRLGNWPDGAGGYTKLEGDPTIETVRLIPQSDKVPLLQTWEGTREKVEYILISVPTAAARFTKGSTFVWRSQVWKISAIHDKPDYAFKADVVLHVG